MTNYISSLQNDKVKNLVKLQKKASARKTQELFVAEGVREVSIALANNVKPHSFFICDDIYNPDIQYPISFQDFKNTPIFYVSSDVYDKVAYRGDTQGIIMIGHTIQNNLNSFIISKENLYLVLESIEKPGNLGAVFRTADAAGINGIIICGQNFDIYNPNVIRSSLGCLFSVPFAMTDNAAALSFLRNNQVQILAAHPEGKTNYTNINLSKSSAVIVGTESDGLSAFWLENADKLIKIPMSGHIDSLNVSVSAAIIAYEAMRQRNEANNN